MAIRSDERKKSRERAHLSDMPDIGDFVRRSRRSAKIARCVTDLRDSSFYRSVAAWFDAPDTQFLLDFIRPDFLLLRVRCDVYYSAQKTVVMFVNSQARFAYNR